jgi:four helix bundle protein
LTDNFPKSEIYSITNQIRRASVSIPSNIAEGAARAYNKEFIQFLNIALGSVAEVDTQLLICFKLGYLKSEIYRELEIELIEIRKMILGLRKYIYAKSK